MEGLDHLGQPAAGDGGKGAHPDGTGAEAVDFRNSVVEILIVFTDGLEFGQKYQTLRADLDAGAVSGAWVMLPVSMVFK